MSFFVYTAVACYESGKSIHPLIAPMQILSRNEILNAVPETDKQRERKTWLIAIYMSVSSRDSMISRKITYKDTDILLSPP